MRFLLCLPILFMTVACDHVSSWGHKGEDSATPTKPVDSPIAQCANGGAAFSTTETCPVVVPPPPTSTDQTITESFTAPANAKADILVIVDTTPSMMNDLEKLSKRFSSLTKSLSGVDWQIAVTNAGASSGWLGSWDAHGQFFAFEDQPQNKTILKSTDPNVDYYFQKTVGSEDDQVKWDDVGHSHPCDFQPYCMTSHPKPLESLKKAIDLRSSKNSGFFRKDAYLIPLMISDADEDEYGGAGAMPPQTLIEYYNKELSSTMRGLIGFGIVIKPGDEKCRAKQDHLFSIGKFGTFVDQFAKLTGGTTMSICETDYTNGLNRISDGVRDQMKMITLSKEPSSQDILVTVTPAVTGLSWTRSGRKLIFSQLLPASAKIKITYKVNNQVKK